MTLVHIDQSSQVEEPIQLFLDCDETQIHQYEGKSIQCMACRQKNCLDPPWWIVQLLVITFINDELAERIGVCEIPLEYFEAATPTTRLFDLA